MQLPISMSFETTAHHDDDRMVHEITICVPGSPESEVWAEVNTRFYSHPETEFVYSSGLGLDRRRAKRLVLAAYDLLLIFKNANDASALTITLADCRKWLNDVLDRDDARVAREKLRRFVRPEVHVCTCISITL